MAKLSFLSRLSMSMLFPSLFKETMAPPPTSRILPGERKSTVNANVQLNVKSGKRNKNFFYRMRKK